VERCDVLIVGGGPAGSACARALRGSDLDVVVLDRLDFPRDKTCAGWVTPPVLAALEVDRGDYAAKCVLQPIHGFRIRRIGDPEAVARTDAVVSYGIRRCEFDHYLLERSGATLRLGEGLRSLERVAGSWVVNGTLGARFLVGAGGHFCPLARRLAGRGRPREAVVAAQELEFVLSPSQAARSPVLPELPEIFFTEDLRGYGWLFRKGDYLNVGLGRLDREHLASHVADFLGFLRREGRLPDLPAERLAGHAYLLYEQAQRPLIAPGALLVGDAAGLAYARSGEGIRPAVESGLLAGRAIRTEAALGAGSLLEGYAHAVEKRFGVRGARRGPGLTDLLPPAWTRRVAGRLFANRWFAQHVVVDRWFTHRFDPALGGAPVR
jgi:flavin-dependent dehydrogenase